MCKWLVYLLAGGTLQAAIIKGSVVENQTGKALARTLISIQPVPGSAGPERAAFAPTLTACSNSSTCRRART